ncbi:OmpH family outer membrane protein [Bacteroidales bacterium OttesenSCG-928-I21]|nr:OmpH family outer membrane protein [Bacteroidales bacterium OttesenSCG-928-I21]
MKKIIFTILVVVLTLSTYAQKGKFGHVDSNSIFAEMPERNQVQKAIEDYARSLENQMQELYKEYETKLTAYETEKDSYSSSVKQLKEEEIMNLQQRIQSFQARAQQDLQNKELELFEPITEKIKTAIKEVGEEKALIYVFDTAGLLYYSSESVDVTPEVKTKLGIK